MFHKILIANRGEIACRIAATARRLGVRTVAVYSDADATARHVALCDEAVHIGGAAAADSYLLPQRILDAARVTGAQAVHPGYGLLSENADFAQHCAESGVTFVGPPAAAIRAMGLKAEAKRLMERAGVPLVPGYHGTDQDAARLRHEAERIGWPVLIKASAGGGGKGMRVVQQGDAFDAALAACRREARAGFGNDAVLLEKYLHRPRHIEIQVFADQHGGLLHLFERDCSVQRRHQKVLEEAPAPGLTEAMRQRLGEAALAAARAVGYVGAGTVEFIAQPSHNATDGVAGIDAFYFMEMNTRLQVEHPVTEAITGLDLVEWQLRVAAGEPLPLVQAELHMRGHAIEARICAENPDNDFLPAAGPLQVYRKPAAAAFLPGPVRIDDGVQEGDAITPHYDSLIAKLIVHGQTRAQALARLDAALAEFHIVGPHTNVQFLRQVLRTRSFARAELDTALIAREHAALFGQRPLHLSLLLAAAVARTVDDEQALETADPFSRRDGWRLHGVLQRRFVFDCAGTRVEALLTYRRDGTLALATPDAAGSAGARPATEGACLTYRRAGDAFDLSHGMLRQRAHVYAVGNCIHVFAALGAARLDRIDLLAQADRASGPDGGLCAPMPGKVLSFAVGPGDAVRKGQALAVIEAMKMEHTVVAPADGIVSELLHAPGDSVGEGAELLRLQSAHTP